MNAEQRMADRIKALDPARSVAVEACAGSGKTWLLASRLLRLLLEGTQPGAILAITYTRKAAREIEARLRGLLAELATVPEAAALKMLTERGLPPAEAQALLPRARALFETVLHAEPAITITTFHGWFARLLSGAPLESGAAGRTLDEAASSLLDEAWAALAADCSQSPAGPLAEALLWLYAELGASNTKKLLKGFVDRRAEWRVWADSLGGLPGVLAASFGVGADPLAELFAPLRLDELEEFARLLGLNTATDQALGNTLAQAVVDVRNAAGEALDSGLRRNDAIFEVVRAAFLTKENGARARKPSAAQAKRLSAGGEERYLALHAAWSERLVAALGALQDQRNAEYNHRALLVGEVLLAKLEELKRSRRVMDFSDLEAEIDALLAQEGTAAWLQARLDARYKHILLDEFQDTNPLQWRILRGWLDAYTGAGAQRPSVFLVGDPKQSIYRFRRAEPKLFAAAAEYFARDFGAERIGNVHTFRNAGGIVALVNAVFDGVAGFTPQTTEHPDLPARVELLPLIPAAPKGTVADAGVMRHPLEEARVDAEDVRRAEEAALIATRINQIVGCWLVRCKQGERPARYSDVLILTRRKTQLATYEAALRAAGIPFVSPGQGGLLPTLEAQDLLAVLRFLADPADNLRLAHSLRTPAFNFTDEDLLAISAAPGAWWPALQRFAADAESPAMQRAVALLSGWLEAAAHLPAHDLIDRIFHESGWFARCRAAVPAALWPGVHANLEALLELALNVDAGRYPSLTRFVDELARLSRSDEEAPDEGLVASAGDGLGRVRIMTIHGAKGLEAPIVWLIDANSTPRSGEGYGVAMDWPADASGPRHFSLLGKLAEAGPARQPLLEAEKAAAEREELNLLYVAITRAEQVFIVSGIEPNRAQNAVTPWKRIEAALSQIGAQQGSAGGLPEEPRAADFFGQAGLQARPDAALRQVPKTGKQRSAAPAGLAENAAGLAFGTAMHAWLEAKSAGWPLPQVAPEVERAARGLCERPALARFFDPAQYLRAGNETAYLDAAGELRRIDRWVECEDAIWVLDYKSGKASEETLLADYRLQIAGYREVLRTIFPDRPVKALLVFAEGGEIPVE
ncbi:UvrD-helicase domain-containing protein [Uliginosibacterium sp. 31-16]|uniref:UvrD-helicase domain-containing protein n=1 Tax=Uliginosibacterium sp. 31-16 TaxID=3068315 RepID=UPI00273E67C3|nr:UvrD-helicase domain-containing protein [Uliginosibacterium sp. 31-16]MDP5239986.1 UvrD-helicase domain-containing protein [Uliginosibacterium sp. 31-16]